MNSPRKISVTQPMAIGVFALLVLVCGIGGWGVFSTFSGAVVARGAIKVEGNTHVVSHEVGGLIAQMPIRNGDQVKAGEVLLRLEDTILQTRLDGVEDQLHEALVLEARLRAQAANETNLIITDDLRTFLANGPTISDRIARHQRQHDLNRQANRRKIAQQHQIMAQIREQIGGAKTELHSHESQLKVIERELVSARKLLSRQLGTTTTLAQLERDQALKWGEIGLAKAMIAEKQQRLIELQSVTDDLSEAARRDALQELGKLETEKAKLFVERAELIVQMRKLAIYAPIDGIIHDLKVSGAGTLVVANEPIVSIVPLTQATSAIVQVQSTDIDQVFVDQAASIRFQAYNARSMPILLGRVRRIGADTIVDTLTKRVIYEVQIDLPIEAIAQLDDVDLVNGMPLTAFLTTIEQTPFQYFARPFVDYFTLSFRDV